MQPQSLTGLHTTRLLITYELYILEHSRSMFLMSYLSKDWQIMIIIQTVKRGQRVDSAPKRVLFDEVHSGRKVC